MSADLPDYTRAMLLKAQAPDGTLKTVAVDADGHLYAVVQGTDGVTLHPVAVDADGQLIMVPRGASGNYLNVDSNGYLTSVMKGADGVTLRTIAVDSNGNILGVLQGYYEGALKTLAVDAQGRMLAVLTDPEDVFGNPHYLGAAELASRLGSIHNFYRTGQVLFMEDFENGLGKMAGVPVGGGGNGYVSTEVAQSGSASLKLTTEATTDSGILVTKILQYPALSKFGVELSVHPQSTTYQLELNMYLSTGALRYKYAIRYVDSVHAWYYLNQGNSYVLIGDEVSLVYNATMFYRVKVIVDLEAVRYHRLIIGDNFYDISGDIPYSYASALPPYLRNDIIFTTKEDAAKTCFIDDVIITQNEA